MPPLTKYGYKITKKKKPVRKKKTQTKSKPRKKYVTYGQVKTMINANKSPEYLKQAIGLFQDATIGTQHFFKTINVGGTTDNNIFTNYKVYKINMPVELAQATNLNYGNGRNLEISLKRMAVNFKIQHNIDHTILFKYAIIELKGSNTGDYANFLTELENNRILNIPGSYITPNQNRVKQSKTAYVGQYKILKQRTLTISPPLDTQNELNSIETTSVNWSKKFGKNGIKVKFNKDNHTDAIGSLYQYILVMIAVRNDGQLINSATSNAVVSVFGTRTVYWENIEDADEP